MNQLDLVTLRQYLQDFDFHSLFVKLGWNNSVNLYPQNLNFYHEYESIDLQYREISNFKNVFVIQIEMKTIPKKSLRQKIATELKRIFAEHILILVDQNQSECLWVTHSYQNNKIIWQEHLYLKLQPDRHFIAKLAQMAISFKDLENNIGLIYTLNRMDKAIDIDKVTKKFYDLFKKEHDAFLKFIDGIPNEDDQQWYASVVINRIMFIYFLQKKVFLNQDINYLSTKLTEFKDHDYYNDFLIKLFFDGFAKKETDRSEEIKNLIGKIPYLNGGLFIPHQIELENKNISIQNQAFERLFKFLNQYDWILDDREIAKENEINPDVLGYIFEKYINQKQMGAYYTKEDITDYISKNCIIPNIFDQLNLDASIFDLMSDDPDRYIHDSIKHGINLDLPTLSNQSVNLNKTASEEFALPTEIWREVIARRNRYAELKNLIINNKIYKINDLITYNLDIKLFTNDVIQRLDETQLKNLWTILNNQKILDPTCGSGAFLFAGLNILYPLYEQVAKRLNLNLTRYALIKSIIINNLYGVDIMHEAVEIAKLRLFLKLVSQVDFVENLEPLPDIDFNIRAGNTLIGYATFDEIDQSISNGQLNFDTDILDKIKIKTQEVGELFTLFHQEQNLKNKNELYEKLKNLELELNRYLAKDYGVDSKNNDKLSYWLKHTKPFHWIVEFFPIISTGGFDVIIGNPPYVEYSKVKDTYKILNYQTESCGNLYAFVMERSLKLLKQVTFTHIKSQANGRCGMIVPISLATTNRMNSMRKIMENISNTLWLSHYADRPSALFRGVHQMLTIFLSEIGNFNKTNYKYFSSNFYHWNSIERDYLFSNKVSYIENYNYIWYKIDKNIELDILKKINQHSVYFKKYIVDHDFNEKYVTYYKNAGNNYYRMCYVQPPLTRENGIHKESSTLNKLMTNINNYLVVAIISSNLFNWWWFISSDCYHLTMIDIYNFKIDIDQISAEHKNKLIALAQHLESDYIKNSTIKSTVYKTKGNIEYQEFYPRKSKHIIDEIDLILAQHYGFTDKEPNYIINYDIKYRMGKDDSNE